ncbi:NAD(P)-dependent dehydrogenase (short-subunit alcohol dehydrogenase family) [Stella humosa]|uniref:NAD(P)-dependent dehydrogenase (Short-subunit alcohol dehydrogenase family) n=1 Tax=Stella humosa TaxID=94 RepID=A0A3N1KX42_9PROT|nr:SDR family oxidoreductase [Stella humosa]ROP84434.1 NAD(P)-dependent dehydrogenase (short-subunit alcohol dehydrogenase family) [Stella humosa]BBK33953.1 3-oxoacyl-ACP reductase [Stella humosa]
MEGFARYPSLEDRAVFVSGGATGIGAAIVEHYVAQGARVAFVDIDEASAAALLERLKGVGPAPLFIPCDLRDIPALRAACAQASSAIGPIRAVVNNAARDDRHTIEEVTPEYWDERMATNLRHQFFVSQALAPAMAEAGGGAIVNFGSISWMGMTPNIPVYLTAKAAVQGLTRALARDLGDKKIRVNTVVPGWVMTERQVSMWLTPEAEARLMTLQCLKEKVYPPDLARMVLWLTADDSRMVSAQTFIVDGGRI